MTDEIAKSGLDSFEAMKKVDDDGNEYWSARKLYPLLGYQEWRHFRDVIAKAKLVVMHPGESVDNHFDASIQMVEQGYGHGTVKPVDDIKLTRYACYLLPRTQIRAIHR